MTFTKQQKIMYLRSQIAAADILGIEEVALACAAAIQKLESNTTNIFESAIKAHDYEHTEGPKLLTVGEVAEAAGVTTNELLEQYALEAVVPACCEDGCEVEPEGKDRSVFVSTALALMDILQSSLQQG